MPPVQTDPLPTRGAREAALLGRLLAAQSGRDVRVDDGAAGR